MSRSRARWVMVAVAVVAACDGDGGPSPATDAPGQDADHVALDLSTDIRERGALRARVHGDTAYTWEDAGRMLLFPLEVDLFDEAGTPTARLTAAEGELDLETKAMVARGEVALTAAAGDRRLETEELHYDPGRGRVWSDVHTVLYRDGVRLEGSGFRADEALAEIELLASTGEELERR